MGLREALIAKGVVSKADKARVERELKDARRVAQGARARSSQVERERAAEAEAARLAALAARSERRTRLEQERERMTVGLQVRQLLQAHRVRASGPVPFHFRGRDGRTLRRLMVAERAAENLRNGGMAVAWDAAGEPCVVTRRAALRLAEIAPSQIAHFVVDTEGISAPECGLPVAVAVPDLRARRVS